MTYARWPLFALSIRTPRLELRLPKDEDFEELCQIIEEGIHAPKIMPFAIPWTREPSPLRERAAMQWWWKCRAEWKPEEWRFTTAVYLDGKAVGMQDLCAKAFPTLKAVTTGSWLGEKHQNKGIGTEMRAAILHLAFNGLKAARAESCAMADNPSSIRVSTKLGYQRNGSHLCVREGKSAELVDFLMVESDWPTTPAAHVPVQIQHLEEALPFFGAVSAEPTEPVGNEKNLT